MAKKEINAVTFPAAGSSSEAIVNPEMINAIKKELNVTDDELTKVSKYYDAVPAKVGMELLNYARDNSITEPLATNMFDMGGNASCRVEVGTNLEVHIDIQHAKNETMLKLLESAREMSANLLAAK
jgi:hypothetical protein